MSRSGLAVVFFSRDDFLMILDIKFLFTSTETPFMLFLFLVLMNKIIKCIFFQLGKYTGLRAAVVLGGDR